MEFFIVREISRGQKRVNGRMVETMEAVVNFGTEEVPDMATRHLKKKPGSEFWTGYNSDRARIARAEIVRQASHSEAVAKRSELRVAELQEAKVDSLNGKLGVREERERLRQALKTAEAVFADAKEGFEK